MLESQNSRESFTNKKLKNESTLEMITFQNKYSHRVWLELWTSHKYEEKKTPEGRGQPEPVWVKAVWAISEPGFKTCFDPEYSEIKLKIRKDPTSNDFLTTFHYLGLVDCIEGEVDKAASKHLVFIWDISRRWIIIFITTKNYPCLSSCNCS